MFPFWDVAIAPLLEAVGPKRVVEVGALRGENTLLMINHLGPGVELHVVDPLPAFDPTEHEQAFPGRYIFHRDLSVNALPKLDPVDVALLDGDHNWYTVYNELKMLSETARNAGMPLPVMIMHDVCWPYGRRDLYYDPTNIPKEHRRPHTRKGIALGQKRLLSQGGLNSTLHNAIEEGGEHNGVMTGLDDFVAEYDKPLRVLVLPVYFGLAVVAEEERLEREPRLAAVFDYLESAEGRLALMEMTEETRLKEAIYYQVQVPAHEARHRKVAQRYLDVIKAALVDEHYIENELRLDLLIRSVQENTYPSLEQVRDPGGILTDRRNAALAARRAGRHEPAEAVAGAAQAQTRSNKKSPTRPGAKTDTKASAKAAVKAEVSWAEFLGSGDMAPYFPYTTVGRDALDSLNTVLDTIQSEGTDGDLVHTGVGRGGVGILMRAHLEAYEDVFRRIWLLDRFHAADHAHHPKVKEPVGLAGGPGLPGLRADLHQVREGFERFDLFDGRTKFLQGDLGHVVPKTTFDKIAVLHIGADQDVDVELALELLYDKVVVGGFVIVDGYRAEGVADKVEAFRSERGISATVERQTWNTVAWRKAVEPEDQATKSLDPARVKELLKKVKRSVVGSGAPLLQAKPKGTVDLSVVVVFYNMKREAERTLHSLSRAYQQGIEDLTYEVLVMENGSKSSQKLGEDYVKGFGPEFRYVDMGAKAKPSPIFALNHGVELARGSSIALMIDGAHMLTPGVLRYGMDAMRLHDPSVVLTQQWYLGPGQQGDAMIGGYDQSEEDQLLSRISWPEDGYRLFDISHFIGGRDWFDGQWESNCIFVPASVLSQVGAFDESFSVAGGGFGNLEFFERIGASPDVTMATILGEGSFHQVHGGTTTNLIDVEERGRRVASYGEEYADLRGKLHRAPTKKMHYVGSMPANALRTRPRRMTSAELFQAPVKGGVDGRPTKPEPIPDEVQEHYLQAFWRSLVWRDTTWLGQRMYKSPMDLFSYQEILNDVRPDWIIETRTTSGARARYLADICELMGHGRVITIDHKKEGERKPHPRIEYINAEYTWGDDVRETVEKIVGPNPKALVILGSAGGKERMTYEFETFMHLVPVGSYVVMEETILNGHPVNTGHGPGPGEAAGIIRYHHPEFEVDQKRERYGLSFNTGGFLKRVAPTPANATMASTESTEADTADPELLETETNDGA